MSRPMHEDEVGRRFRSSTRRDAAEHVNDEGRVHLPGSGVSTWVRSATHSRRETGARNGALREVIRAARRSS